MMEPPLAGSIGAEFSLPVGVDTDNTEIWGLKSKYWVK